MIAIGVIYQYIEFRWGDFFKAGCRGIYGLEFPGFEGDEAHLALLRCDCRHWHAFIIA